MLSVYWAYALFEATIAHELLTTCWRMETSVFYGQRNGKGKVSINRCFSTGRGHTLLCFNERQGLRANPFYSSVTCCGIVISSCRLQPDLAPSSPRDAVDSVPWTTTAKRLGSVAASSFLLPSTLPWSTTELKTFNVVQPSPWYPRIFLVKKYLLHFSFAMSGLTFMIIPSLVESILQWVKC